MTLAIGDMIVHAHLETHSYDCPRSLGNEPFRLEMNPGQKDRHSDECFVGDDFDEVTDCQYDYIVAFVVVANADVADDSDADVVDD